MPTLPRAVMSFALLHRVTQGINVYVSNNCEESMTLAHVTPGGVSTDEISAGGSITKVMPIGTGSHVFKSGIGAQATLAEFSTQGGKCWVDISIIPTSEKSGPDLCTSLDHCKEYTGGVGFNVPIQITPHTPDGDRCIELTCMADGCPQAYQFPKDDGKTHCCPLSTDFDLTFCPGGSGKKPMPPPISPPVSPPMAPAPTPTDPPTSPPTPIQMPLPPTTSSTEQTTPTVDVGESPEQEEPEKQEEQVEPEKQEEKQEEQEEKQEEKEETKEEDQKTTEQVPKTAGSGAPADGNKLRKIGYENVPQQKSGIAGSPATEGTLQKLAVATEKQKIWGNPSTPVAATGVVEKVQQVNNKSVESSTNSTPYVVLSIGGFVGLVAAAAIFVVRKKKAELDELETKTPLSAGAHGVMAGFRTPRDNISVL